MRRWTDYKKQVFDGWHYPSFRNMFVTLPWFLGFLLCLYWGLAAARVVARQDTSLGTITGQRRFAREFDYTFRVSDVLYRGADIPPEKSRQRGQKVTVYFDSRDPTTNSLTDFVETRDQNLGVAFSISTMIAAVFFLIFWLRRRHDPSSCNRCNQ